MVRSVSAKPILSLEASETLYLMPVLSSLLFLTNTLHASYRGYWIYGLSFLALVITSVFFHTSNKTDLIIFWSDQMAIYCVFILGFIYFLHISSVYYKLIAIITFLTVLSIFFGGYATSTLCWDSDKDIGSIYHSFIHIIVSAGHHFIMAGLSPLVL